MRNSRVIAAYKRHTSQHMVLKEDIKKKNYTSFKSVVDVLVVFPLLQDVEILCAVWKHVSWFSPKKLGLAMRLLIKHCSCCESDMYISDFFLISVYMNWLMLAGVPRNNFWGTALLRILFMVEFVVKFVSLSIYWNVIFSSECLFRWLGVWVFVNFSPTRSF